MPIGSLSPNHIHLPGIFVHRIVPATTDPQIEFMVTRPDNESAASADESILGKGEARAKRERIARAGPTRIPTMCADA